MQVASRTGFWYRFSKRALDLAIAAPAVVVLSPLLAIIALLVRVTSPGPILFRQQRLGLNGTVFTVFKFRTMVVHEARTLADKVVLSGDPRITRLGRILRDFR